MSLVLRLERIVPVLTVLTASLFTLSCQPWRRGVLSFLVCGCELLCNLFDIWSPSCHSCDLLFFMFLILILVVAFKLSPVVVRLTFLFAHLGVEGGLGATC